MWPHGLQSAIEVLLQKSSQTSLSPFKDRLDVPKPLELSAPNTSLSVKLEQQLPNSKERNLALARLGFCGYDYYADCLVRVTRIDAIDTLPNSRQNDRTRQNQSQ